MLFTAKLCNIYIINFPFLYSLLFSLKLLWVFLIYDFYVLLIMTVFIFAKKYQIPCQFHLLEGIPSGTCHQDWLPPCLHSRHLPPFTVTLGTPLPLFCMGSRLLYHMTLPFFVVPSCWLLLVLVASWKKKKRSVGGKLFETLCIWKCFSLQVYAFQEFHFEGMIVF